jgi:hypothetical protein
MEPEAAKLTNTCSESSGERGWKHDHNLKGTLLCAECGSRLYYTRKE